MNTGGKLVYLRHVKAGVAWEAILAKIEPRERVDRVVGISVSCALSGSCQAAAAFLSRAWARANSFR